MRYHFGPHTNPKQLWTDAILNPSNKIAVDTESPSLSDSSLLGIGIAVSPDDGFYVTPDDENFPTIVQLIGDKHIRKVYHNTLYDLRVLREYKPDVFNVDDTAMMCRLVPMQAVLEYASFWVDRQTERASSLMSEYNVTTMDKLPIEIVAKKCCMDCRATYALSEYLPPKINMKLYETDRRLIPLLDIISRTGIKLDKERRNYLEQYYTKHFSIVKTKANAMGFSLGSNFEVGYMLAERGHFLPMTESKRYLAVGKSILEKLNDPIADMRLQYKHIEKMLSTYLIPFRDMDRAYSRFHIEAATSRISSTSSGKNQKDRNLQNLPKRAEQGDIETIRSMFTPDNSMFTFMDMSQIELRVLAYLSQDKVMLEVYNDPNGDIHEITRIGMGYPNTESGRVNAKTFNFAMIFGADPSTIADRTGSSDIQKISHLMQLWFETYPEAAQWMKYQKENGMRNGYVETLMGRKLLLPLDQGEKHIYNCSINYPIQGSAAEIFKQVILEIEHLVMDMRLPLHDELILNSEYKLNWEELAHLTPIYSPFGVKYKDRWE